MDGPEARMTADDARKLAELIASGTTRGPLVTEHPTKVDVLTVHVKTEGDNWPRYDMTRFEWMQIVGMVHLLIGDDPNEVAAEQDEDEDDEEEDDE